MSENSDVAHYDSSYENFASGLFSAIRAEVFGEDIGQNGWLTAEEQDIFIPWLNLNENSTFLDIACGSGGPTLRIIQKTASRGHGIDLHNEGIIAAKAQAAKLNISERAEFKRVDASGLLLYKDGSFSGLICIDAVNHLPDRKNIFREWARILQPGGRLVFH